METLITKL